MEAMEPSSEVPMFVDVDRGPDYSELDKILKEPVESKNVGEQHMDAQKEPPAVLSEPQRPEKLEPKPRIKCPECQRYTTDNEERMIRHIRKNHRGENPFQCTMCEYSTYNKSLFEEHDRIHKGIKPFKCAYCPYRSASKKNKNKHELIHRKNNPLKCDLCPFIAHHYRSLLCHKQKHENGELVKKEIKKENKTTEKKVQCDICSCEFSSRIELERHKNNHKSRLCDTCNARFCSSYYLKKHMAAVHDVRKEMFRCEVCGWVGSLKMKVLLHLIHHPQTVDETLFDVSVLRKRGIMV